MTTPRTLRVSSPADLLALVPTVLGFHPRESLVLVVTGGESALHARLDLPRDEAETAAAIETTLRATVRVGAREVVLIAYAEEARPAGDVVAALLLALEAAGVAVLCAVRADGHRWFSLDCDDDCCPVEGVPYDVSAHPFTAQSVVEGRVTFRDRQELADSLVGTDTDAIEQVAEAAESAMRAFENAGRHPLGMESPEGARRHLVTEGRWVRDRLRRFVQTGEPLDAAEAGRLLAALLDLEVRDVAWAEIDRFNARTHVELWRDLVRRSPLDLAAAPAGLLGFAGWLAGDGATAWCAVDRCRQADPDYTMADLLTEALEGVLPPSAWTPVPPDALTLFAG